MELSFSGVSILGSGDSTASHFITIYYPFLEVLHSGQHHIILSWGKVLFVAFKEGYRLWKVTGRRCLTAGGEKKNINIYLDLTWSVETPYNTEKNVFLGLLGV